MHPWQCCKPCWESRAIALSECFSRWVADLSTLSDGEVIAIDGKCLRRSLDSASDKAAIYMVSAWATQNQLVLGQQRVDDKSNEITAIPKLLMRLDIAGAVVTLDAMGCQTAIARQIVDQEADYLLSLKGNQGTLHRDVKRFFESANTCLLGIPATTVGMGGLKPALYGRPRTSSG